jgi:hypothetical protein
VRLFSKKSKLFFSLLLNLFLFLPPIHNTLLIDIDEWYEGPSQQVRDQAYEQVNRLIALQSSLKWINVQATLLDICIAFYPLDLPPYVLLEIVDCFPFWSTHVNHKKKIDYIIQIKRFCDDLTQKRERNEMERSLK